MNRRPNRKSSAASDFQRLYGAAACALLLAGATAGVTAIGCGWSFINEHSVRFSGYTTGEFTRLPPLPINSNARPNTRRKELPAARHDGDEEEYEAQKKREEERNEIWAQAGEAEDKSDFAQTGRLLREYLQRVSAENDFLPYGAEERQLRRNSAIDRLDALTALGQGARPTALAAYLAIRRDYDRMVLQAAEWRDPWNFRLKRQETSVSRQACCFEDLRHWLDSEEQRPSLADNFTYLRAALVFREEKWDEAAQAFTELAARYPRSEKREAALLMAGRARVKRFEQALQEADNETDRARQKSLLAARQALRQCLHDYPRGRFALDARGWLAHLSLIEGDRASALSEYYRLLAEATDATTRQSLLISLRWTRHHASDEEKRQVESELADEPAAAMVYAYHTLYNYAPNAGAYLLNCKGEDILKNSLGEEETEAAFSHQVGRPEQERIVAFATDLLRRYPTAPVSGGFALRLAQAQLELGDHKAALQSSTRALRLGVKGHERLEALWMKGSSEWSSRDFAAARRTLKQLIAESPQSDLAEGAGRLIAMAAEDAGDLDGALEQYIALNYEDDFAYFVDVLMTPEQLAGFIARHPDSSRINDLNYAMAVRYMRATRWAEARAALSRVKVTEQESVRQYAWTRVDDPVEFRSTSRTAKVPGAGGVAARYLWRDLKTIEDLERLEREAAEAQGDEAKAEALYQLASYLYQGSSLLFYNPGLWGGVRHYKLEELESNNGFRAPGETQLLWQHALEHEPVAHALDIYLDVAHRFPNTRAARDALYTAVICHERLSNYNTYWRNIYGMGLHAGARMVSYRDVRRAYPNYRLPRETMGWEPVTRTVNGGPGWAEAPKPKPRLSWQARIKERLARGFAETSRKLNDVNTQIKRFRERVITGVTYSLLAVSLLAVCYFTTIGLYIKNQQTLTALFEEERSAEEPPDGLTGSTGSRVEKIINDSLSGAGLSHKPDIGFDHHVRPRTEKWKTEK